MDEDVRPIGERLRALRRWRGLTQVELAGLAGVTNGAVSMWESGVRPLDRRSTIAALAAALRVSETELTGGPHLGGADRLRSEPHQAIPALREAFAVNSIGNPASDGARPLPQVTAQMGSLRHAHDAGDYVNLGHALPGILGELYMHASDRAGDDGHAAARALVEVCGWAAWMCHSMRYGDLAQIAARAGMDAARVAGDAVSMGKAQFAQIGTAPLSWAYSLAMSERAANALEPHARDPLGCQVLGMLTLRCALASAALQDGAAVAHWLGEAQALASRVDDEPASAWEWFSATNVAIWRLSLAVERGDSGRAVLELASGADPDKLTVAVRRAGLYLDVGRGLARDRRTQVEAVRWLHRAERAAPQFVRNYASARETVLFLLSSARAAAGGRELRGMAARMGVPH